MEEEKARKRKNIITILTIITVALYVAIFFMLEEREAKSAKEQAAIVTNYSEFYTVSACANKYISLLGSRDADSLLKVLSESYKRKNFITSSNVSDNLPIVAGGTTFLADRIYYEKQSDDIFKYYISGFLETGGLDMNEQNRIRSYLIVYLDKKNNVFSIEPYDGREYTEGVFE